MAGSTGGGASKRVLRRGLATGGRLVAICLRRRNTCENAMIYSQEGHNRTGVFRPEFTYGSQGAPDVFAPFTDKAALEDGRPFGRTRCGAELPRANLQEWDADAPRQCLQSL